MQAHAYLCFGSSNADRAGALLRGAYLRSELRELGLLRVAALLQLLL